MISDDSLTLLRRLIETPSPSGFEGANATDFREYVAPFVGCVTAETKQRIRRLEEPAVIRTEDDWTPT